MLKSEQEVYDHYREIRDNYQNIVLDASRSKKVMAKTRDIMRVLNSAQNAVDRYELMHEGKTANPLDEMASQWKRAIDRASDAVGVEA